MPEVLQWPDRAIEQSRARRRVKYEVIGLTTRAQALVRLGRTRAAITDLHRAVAAARPVADPALALRPLLELLALDGDDALAAELGTAVERIRAALPQPEMRHRFEAAELVCRALEVTANQRSGRAAAKTSTAL